VRDDLRLVIVLPKRAEGTHGQQCADVARAAVACRDRLRADTETGGRKLVSAWEREAMGKICLRARAAQLDDVRALPGAVAAGEATALPPARRSQRPEILDKLQATGWEDLDLDEIEDLDAPLGVDGPHALLVLTGAHELSLGKACAQAAHAAHELAREAAVDWRLAWREAGWPVVVRRAGSPELFAEAGRRGILVEDAGFTELPPGTATVAGVPLG
jgi:peptidyl-tRNA hydrolase